jgi:Glycosyl transferase family 2
VTGALPLVSIVVPSWQKGPFLRYALESLAEQTYPHLEVIVQDNVSTDETVAILQEFEPRRARVVRERDRGQSDALSRGFERCRGQILSWLNADDMLMPDAIARAVAALESPPRPDVVYGHTALLTQDGQFSRYFCEIQPFSSQWLRNFGPFIAQPSTFFRRAAYVKTGGLDTSLHYAMDWDLWCKMARSGHTFRFVDEVWSGTRMYQGTKTSTGGLPRIREILRVNRRHQTTRFPLAASAHFLGDILPGRGPVLHGFFRWGWRHVTGRGKSLPTVVHGLTGSNVLAETPTRIRFPVYDQISGASVRLAVKNPGTTTPRLRADLNGIAGEWIASSEPHVLEAVWRCERPVPMASVDLEVEPLNERGSAGLSLVSFLLDKKGPTRSRGTTEPSAPRS